MKKIGVLIIFLLWTNLCFAKGDGYNKYLATTNKANKLKDKAAAMASVGNGDAATYYTNKANNLANKANNMHAIGYGYYKSVACDKLSDKLTEKWWNAKGPATHTFNAAANASIASINLTNWGQLKADKGYYKFTNKANYLATKASNTNNSTLSAKYLNKAVNTQNHANWIANTILPTPPVNNRD